MCLVFPGGAAEIENYTSFRSPLFVFFFVFFFVGQFVVGWLNCFGLFHAGSLWVSVRWLVCWLVRWGGVVSFAGCLAGLLLGVFGGRGVFRWLAPVRMMPVMSHTPYGPILLESSNASHSGREGATAEEDDLEKKNLAERAFFFRRVGRFPQASALKIR